MQLINKYGLDKGDANRFLQRMQAVTQRIEQEVAMGKSLLLEHSPLRPGYVALTSISQKEDQTDFLHRISIDMDKRLISLACSFMDTAGIYILKTRDHRLMACRYALNYNNKFKDFQLKINPSNGDVIFSHTSIFVETLEELEKNLPQLIMDLLERLKIRARQTRIGLEEYFIMDKPLEDKKPYPDSPINPTIERLSRYIQLSNKVAFWQLHPTNKKVENVYRKSQTDFKATFVNKAKASAKKFLWEVFPVRSLPEFPYALTKQEGEIIDQLSRPLPTDPNKKEEQLKIINTKVDQKSKENIPNGQPGCYTALVDSTLMLRFDLVEDTNLLKRQKQILKKLKQQELLPGLPQYYAFDKMQELSTYRITNLSASCDTYLSFLEKNKETLSITTKLDILKQIITTMLKLRGRSMMICNISPKSIRIDQEVRVKIFDLSRAYASDIDRVRPGQSSMYMLPNQEGDEREDSYSFGVLMYRTIFGQTPFLPRFKALKKVLETLPQPTVALEKFEAFGPKQLMRLAAHLSLKCIGLKEVNLTKDRQEAALRGIPYMDWLMLGINQMLKHLQ